MSILTKIFGDRSLINIDNKVDQLMSLLPKDSHLNDNDETTGKMVDSFLSGMKEDEVSKIFQNVNAPSERINRYNVCDEIKRSVPIIRRILSVYIANLLPKNPSDGKSIVYRDVKFEESDKDESLGRKVKLFCQEVVESYHLVKKLKLQVLPMKLLYGDCFVEAVDFAEDAVKVDFNNPGYLLTENSKLLESKILLQDVEAVANSNTFDDITTDRFLERLANQFIAEDSQPHYRPQKEEVLHPIPKSKTIKEGTDAPSDVDTEDLEKEEDANEEKKKLKSSELDDVLIRIHRPHNIIALETLYGTRVGYLEIMKIEDTLINSAQNITQVIGRLTTIGKKVDYLQDKLVNKLIFHILKKILDKAKKTGTPSANFADNNALLRELDPNIYAFLKRVFVEQGIFKKEGSGVVNVRFIPPNRMVHFTTGSTDYFPYGESVVEPLILPGKLYIIAQLANAITKLSRASVMRKSICAF